MNNRLPTMDNLIKRGVLVNSDGCKFCISNQESADHVFAVCSTTKTVSTYLSNWVNWWPTSAGSISELWESIDSGSSGSLDRMIRRPIGAAFFWVLWNQRNNKTFSGAVKKEREIAEDIKFLAYDWIRGRVKAGRFIRFQFRIIQINNLLPMIVLTLLAMDFSIGMAQTEKTKCDPAQLVSCLGPIVKGTKPSSKCCSKLKEQKSCLCRYIKDPNYKKYVNSPGAKKLLRSDNDFSYQYPRPLSRYICFTINSQ
ncbi:hypothetical protein OSB04_027437 [Centaurea solstitialis]|uniref:Bifunctional inhibitor/plant lipid transfer protein/seed storage helical domain-containing protein n=1 Tax=Centaurea solstitialis TaxID=347529 RepID=A0AA38SS50_9ASTR|nr:hypothetical protein OSB04_027437 [Centaurea solstitialis]